MIITNLSIYKAHKSKCNLILLCSHLNYLCDLQNSVFGSKNIYELSVKRLIKDFLDKLR